MERPVVRQIENQQVESEKEITGFEAEQILRKYGHQLNFDSKPSEENNHPNLTFEEMIQLEENRKRDEENRKRALLYGPKPKTFGTQNGYSSEVKYGTEEDTGFNFKIEITTDMNLPKY